MITGADRPGDVATEVPTDRTPHPGRPAEPTTRSPGPRPARLYVLDLLRFVAAICVVVYHYLYADEGAWDRIGGPPFDGPVRTVVGYGFLGVEFFFVISGFVICMSSWGRPLSAFFVSRVTRIMPAYLFAVLFTAGLLTVWPLRGGRPEPSHVLLHLTFLQPFLKVPAFDIVYWTLFVELRFYLLFAILVWFGVTYRRVVLFCVLWTTVSLFAQLTGLAPLIAVVQPFWTSFFVTGIVLYLIHRFGPNLLLWGMLGVSMLLTLHTIWQRVETLRDPAVRFPVAVGVVFAFYGVMTGVALGWFSWVRWRGLLVVGALTYPLYLLHAQAGRVLFVHGGAVLPPWALLTTAMAAALSLAYLVQRFVERPSSRVLRRGLLASFAQIRTADAVVSQPHRPPVSRDRHGSVP